MSKLRQNPPVCLIIMDGFGLAPAGPGNAISLAQTPCLDELFAIRPWTKLHASEEPVGLPAGQMGNSEVGHLNIGAGRVVYQELTRINKACQDGSLLTNDAFLAACKNAIEHDSVFHFMGLLSDGGVHSHIEHLFALVDAAAALGVRRILVHGFLDGRDVPPASGFTYVEKLEGHLVALRAQTATPGFSAEIGSLMGRYFAMDRDNRWDRVHRAYDTLVAGAGETQANPVDAVQASYARQVTDEFVEPISFGKGNIETSDSVLFFNFRPDRARELSRAFVDEDFTGFEREIWPRVHYACLTEYDPTIEAPVLFPKEFPQNVLADVLANQGYSQYHIAETEKYAHVTFFLNGGVEAPKCNEARVLIPSPKVATYDLQPAMSAPQVATTLAQAITDDEADVYIVNFANCDMVGHTGSIPATVAAVEAVDAGVQKVLDALRDKSGVAFVTADHGNADKMIADDGTPHTAHTTALVPFIAVNFAGPDFCLDTREDAALCDIAPTLLSVLGQKAPCQMSGKSLIVTKSCLA